MNVGIRTRAGDNGREICCPKCKCGTWVYHFSWSALKCMFCKSDFKKTDWELVLTIKDLKTKKIN